MDIVATELVQRKNGVRDGEDGSSLCMKSGRLVGERELDRGFHVELLNEKAGRYLII